MKWLPRLLLLLVALTAGGVCMRLGIWQLSRRVQKQHLNEAIRTALAGAPLELGDSLPRWEQIGHRVVVVRGRFDDRIQVLLGGREHLGQPGVEVVTPLVLDSSHAVMVDRGWLSAEDPTSAHPERFAEPAPRPVRALAESLPGGVHGALTRLPGDSAVRYLALHLNRDSLASRLPYALSNVVLHELPGPGVPSQPLRSPPEPLDETMHLSYAVQWFAIAAAIVGGSVALAVRGMPRPAAPRPLPEHSRH